MEDKITNIKERILKIPENKGISKEVFFKEIGMTYGNFKGKSKETPINSNAIAEIIAKYSDINVTWLITGEGEMFLEDKSTINTGDMGIANEPIVEYNINKVNLFDKSSPVDVQEVPLYDLEATAGILSLFNDTHSNPVDTIRIPGVPKCDGAIPITGDSMYPLLKSGDIVLYKQVNDPLTCTYFWGEMYIVGLLQDGETFVMVKYIQRSELGAEYIKLVSQNQHHNPIDVLKININALALVRASVRINAMQ